MEGKWERKHDAKKRKKKEGISKGGRGVTEDNQEDRRDRQRLQRARVGWRCRGSKY